MSDAHRMESHKLHVEVRQRLPRGDLSAPTLHVEVLNLRLSTRNTAYSSMGMLPVGKTHRVGVKH